MTWMESSGDCRTGISGVISELPPSMATRRQKEAMRGPKDNNESNEFREWKRSRMVSRSTTHAMKSMVSGPLLTGM